MPIGEKVLLIYDLVPIVIIYSSSTGDFFPFPLIFLEEYYALLNELFGCSSSRTSLNRIVLIFYNDKK